MNVPYKGVGACLTIQSLLGRCLAFLPPQTPLVWDDIYIYIYIFSYLFKVRLIDAHLSIDFPRLSEANLPPKGPKKQFLRK